MISVLSAICSFSFAGPLDSPVSGTPPGSPVRGGRSLWETLLEKYKIVFNAEFKEGDFLYGLQGKSLAVGGPKRGRESLGKPGQEIIFGREAILPHLKQNVALGVLTADQINNYLIRNVSEDCEGKNKLAQFKSFDEFIEKHPELDPFRKDESLLSAESAGDDALSEGLKTRRVCKAVILFAMEARKKIHFMLDSVDIAQVVSKVGNKNKDRNYTNSELRFISRYWYRSSKSEKEKLLQTVKFYENGREVRAPWFKAEGTLKSDWEAYFQTLDDQMEDLPPRPKRARTH